MGNGIYRFSYLTFQWDLTWNLINQEIINRLKITSWRKEDMSDRTCWLIAKRERISWWIYWHYLRALCLFIYDQFWPSQSMVGLFDETKYIQRAPVSTFNLTYLISKGHFKVNSHQHWQAELERNLKKIVRTNIKKSLKMFVVDSNNESTLLCPKLITMNRFLQINCNYKSICSVEFRT